MAKSLQEFNENYRFNQFLEMEEAEKAIKKTTISSVISTSLFYFVIIGMVLAAFIYSQQAKKGGNILGFSYYNILTRSMQSELPQGSFILVQARNEKELKVGDDITFAENETKLITHRIIQIYEDYEDSGMRGFQTQGVDNPAPDENIVYSANIVGKVIWSVPHLGIAFEVLADNVVIVIILFVILFALAFFLKIFFTPDRQKARAKEVESESE